MRVRELTVALGVLLLLQDRAIAFKEDANEPYVVTSGDGRCYAKAVPKAVLGHSGVTTIYAVEAKADRLLQTFEWYTPEPYLFLQCDRLGPSNDDVFVVRVLWPYRGDRATASTIAMVIYRNGDVVKEYSTLDIAGKPDNIQNLDGHYEVFDQLLGFGTSSVFRARRVDDRILSFRVSSGAVVVTER